MSFTTVVYAGTVQTEITESLATFTSAIAGPGPKGDAATVQAGTVTTLSPGSPATVVNSGTVHAAVFNFGIPEGEKGDKGDQGDQGEQGDPGPQGIPGVVAASAPITYNAGTQTVGIDQSGFLLKSGNLAGLASVSTARDNLGLGSAALENVNDLLTASNNLSDLEDAPTSRLNLGLGTMATEAAADYLKVINNLSDLEDAGEARGFLGLGTMATEASADYLAKSGNLSGLASVSTARTNLGLGTMATEASADYLAKSGNLSGLASNATARTNLDVYSKAESDALVPAASTTVAGKVELATDAEAVAVNLSNVALTPVNLLAFRNETNRHDYKTENFTAGTSGTGATTAQSFGTKLVSAPTSAVGHATLIDGWQTAAVGSSANAGFDWSKKIDFVFRFNRQLGTADSNSLFRILCGKATNGYTVGDLAGRGMGIRCVNGQALELQVHNGTTLTNVTSSFTPSTQVTYSCRIFSDGAGNVTLWVDGNQVATTAAGASSSSTSTGNGLAFEAQNIGTITGTKAQVQISNYLVTII